MLKILYLYWAFSEFGGCQNELYNLHVLYGRGRFCIYKKSYVFDLILTVIGDI